MPKGKKGSKRVVLGTGSFDWEDGEGWLMLEQQMQDLCTGRRIQKKFVGKRIRLIAEVHDAQRG